jgi:hypothetical protein
MACAVWIGRGAFVLLLLMAHSAAAQDCGKMYSNAGKSLLFGGLANGCNGPNCQSRDSFW